MASMNVLQVAKRASERRPWLTCAVVVGPATHVHGCCNQAAGVTGFFCKEFPANSVKPNSAKLGLPEDPATADLRMSLRRRRTHAAAPAAAGDISSRELAVTTS